MTCADAIVIGGGIAGAGVAAGLAEHLRVVLLEREAQVGAHATGRSAALFSETYGNGPVRALSQASRPFFFAPPSGFAPVPLVQPRGSLHIATPEQLDALEAFAAEPDVARVAHLVTAAEALALCPLLRPDYVGGGVYEPLAQDLEVDVLHQAFLRQLRARGGDVRTDCGVSALTRRDGVWQVTAGEARLEAPLVVNAAGAWADAVAALAGLAPLGVTPMRRTAVLVDAPPDVDLRAAPLVIDAGETFYFKPDAGRLLLSPADETPSEPCDAQPDEWDVAVAVDRVQQAANLEVRSIRRRWAGLRSFVADRTPVAGFDPRAEGFFWLAGQGGYGIQTAPALSRAAAALALGKDIPADLAAFGVRADDLAPGRLLA